MAEVDTSIYRPQPQTGIGSLNPLQLLGLAQGATQFGSDLAVNKALKDSYDPNSPTGINKPDFVNRLRKDPNARVGLPQALQQSEDLARAGFERTKAQTQFTSDMLGTLLADPNPTPAKFAKLLAIGAAGGADPLLIGKIRDVFNGDPKNYKSGLATIAGIALGTGPSLSPATGTPTPGGAATEVPALSKVRTMTGVDRGTSPAAAPGAPGAAVPGMRTGTAAGFQKEAESQVASYNKLHDTVEDAPNQHAMLDTLASDLKIAGDKFGPWIKAEKNANALSMRLAGMGITMSPQQLQALESFDKVTTQIAQSQAASFHATDANLTAAFGANPNSTMSKLGVEGVLAMLHGNLDAMEAKRNASLAAGITEPNQYRKWSAQFNKEFDPRVFQYARLSPEKRKEFVDALGGVDAKGVPKTKAGKDFDRRLWEAQQKGWLTPQGEAVR